MTDALVDLEEFRGLSQKEMELRISRLAPAAKAELDKLLLPEYKLPWIPNKGPQTEAYYSEADLLLYGGAAGGGKSDLLVGLALTRHKRSVIFRRAFVDLRGVEERLIEMRKTRDGFNGAEHFLRTSGTTLNPGGQLIEFGALEKPGAEYSWQGRPHDFLGFDEGAQLTAGKVAYIIGWLRSTDKRQRKRVVIASNPPMGAEGQWLLAWFAPWLDPLFPEPARPGELRWAITVGEESRWVATQEPVIIEGETYTPLSRTFIPASLDDNPYLRDTGYRAQIQNLPEPLRSQLLKGDFLAGREDDPWQVIPTAWIGLAEERWASNEQPRTMDVIGVDVAMGGIGHDSTILAPLRECRFDPLITVKGLDTTKGPVVAGEILRVMRNGALPVIDMTGGWGGSARDHLEGQGIHTLPVIFSEGSQKRSKSGDYQYVNKRSELWWQFREALDPESNDPREMPGLPPDRKLRAQLSSPKWVLRGKRILIESKDDIRKRLGSSTDEADAVIMAWHGREEAALRRLVRSRPARRQTPVFSDPLADFR